MKKILFEFGFMLLFIVPLTVFSQIKYCVKSHNILISGTSNLHDWTATAGKTNGTCLADTNDVKLKIQNIHIEIDAQSLISSKGSIMDSKMNDALKSDKFPKITFDYKQPILFNKSNSKLPTTINGLLTISGKTQKVDVVCFCKISNTGIILVMGSKKLKMSDFGIEPPTALFGALKTADEITVNFNIILSPINK